MKGKGSYIKKLEDGVDVIDSLKECDFSMYYMGEDGKRKKLKVSEYISQHNALAEYECKIFEPNHNNFNLWTGFQAEETEEMGNLKLIKKFIFETWASSNLEYYEYIISWFKGLLTNDLNRVALCMISKPGTGKGWLLNFLRLVLRSSNIAEVNGVQSIVQKHNTIIQNKRLVVINEMSSTKEEFRANFDKIKMNITDTKLTVEPKGVNPYEIDNIGNYILFSNHKDSIICEQFDRRYAIFEVCDKYLNNASYFDELTKKCHNQSTANAFYTYLLDFTPVEIREIIETDIRQEVIGLSKPVALKFVDYILENPITKFNEETGEMEKIKEIRAIDLYEQFRFWCNQNGERNIPTNTKFGLALNSKLVKNHTKHGNVYVL